jgi:ADP-ribose pyrophosphatase YjhB (NUDIX family)
MSSNGVDHIGVGVVFFCHDGRGNYLLHKRSATTRDDQGTWDVGGGALEFHELLEDGMKREIKEEYCADALDHEFIGFRQARRDNGNEKTHWIAFDFRVRVDRDQVRNGAPKSIDELGWFRLDKLPTPLHSQLPTALALYKDKLA